MLMDSSRPLRRRGVTLLGFGGLVVAGLLANDGLPNWVSPAQGSAPDHQVAASVSTTLQLVDQAPSPGAAPESALRGSPESRLIAVYRLIAAGHYAPAQQAAEALSRQFPKFKLAQLVYGDLMAARFGGLTTFGSAATAASPAAQTDLSLLKDEAILRLRALQERPPEGAVPAEFVRLPASVRYAIAVETSRARLYLFENTPKGLVLVEDVYISVGKQGVDKLVEGDQKTPLGVYYTTDQLDPRSLQERFGAGALPLNYPNAYDKVKGRTGSGILLHGVSPTTYSRPPLDSDGCVAMANDDLQRLAAKLPQRDTPVVITRELHWVAPNQSPAAAPEAFNRALQDWQDARLRADYDKVRSLYATDSGPSDGASDVRLRQRVQKPPQSIDDVSVLTWRDEKDKMVVTYRELGVGPGGRAKLMRQYWSQSGKDWRIVAEGPVR